MGNPVVSVYGSAQVMFFCRLRANLPQQKDGPLLWRYATKMLVPHSERSGRTMPFLGGLSET